MRPLLHALTLGAFAMLPATATAGAQQPAAGTQPTQPGVIVVSYNKCALDAPARLDSLNALAAFPVLDELVREGRLMGWGVLGHLWGDEWNYIVYYSAANLTAFHGAWEEFISRVRSRRPTFASDLTQYCTEHKDNIYGVRRLSATAPAAPR